MEKSKKRFSCPSVYISKALLYCVLWAGGDCNKGLYVSLSYLNRQCSALYQKGVRLLLSDKQGESSLGHHSEKDGSAIPEKRDYTAINI